MRGRQADFDKLRPVPRDLLQIVRQFSTDIFRYNLSPAFDGFPIADFLLCVQSFAFFLSFFFFFASSRLTEGRDRRREGHGAHHTANLRTCSFRSFSIILERCAKIQRLSKFFIKLDLTRCAASLQIYEPRCAFEEGHAPTRHIYPPRRLMIRDVFENFWCYQARRGTNSGARITSSRVYSVPLLFKKKKNKKLKRERNKRNSSSRERERGRDQ